MQDRLSLKRGTGNRGTGNRGTGNRGIGESENRRIGESGNRGIGGLLIISSFKRLVTYLGIR